MRRKHSFYIFMAVFIFSAGCTAPPSEKTVRDTIGKYFEARQYIVKDITFGKITSLPLSNKKYMGKEGYTVEIKSITLESKKDVPLLNYKKGQFLIFSNAIIQIREKRDKSGLWEISEISGIPVI